MFGQKLAKILGIKVKKSLHFRQTAGIMSGYLLFNASSAIVQLYHGENKLFFNEMMMMSALY